MRLPAIKNPRVVLALRIIAVPVLGFALLNAAFMATFFFQTAIDLVVGLFTTADLNNDWPWYPPFKMGLSLFLLAVISWKVLRSKKLGVTAKAVFTTLPAAASLLITGILTFEWPAIGTVLGVAALVITLYVFRRKRLHWLYSYAIILVAAFALTLSLLGLDV